MTSADTILGHLATTGWFAKNGEAALTTGLKHCLQKDPPAAAAFLDLLRKTTGVKLPERLLWQAERVQDNKARVDVAGSVEDDMSRALVLVEAKVLAAFADDQVLDYLQAQQRSLTDSPYAGVVVVLVPESRVTMVAAELALELTKVNAQGEGAHWIVPGPSEVHVTVLSWDEVVAAMQARASDASADLDQLLGAARTLRGSDVPAFTAEDLADGWATRREDLDVVIERVTADATRALGLKLMPWQGKSLDGLEAGYRYVGVVGVGGEPNLAVGVRTNVQDHSPLWVRWHRATPELAAVAGRLRHFGDRLEKHDGHLWIPLTFQADSGAATRQIRDLATEVATLYRIAADRPIGDPGVS